ncbi:PIN domain-containing protein [Streptomyces ureilyticus]|uniref:Ribonuclease VapC n=1 Tax=Streptomyces ureilyticus TaxID=1775131 RepID=A0ABX0E2J6_9ACTN|nr:PIN domain-containing protein [Streptomyces ureilyticus]NGO48431.1 type II toxin-antitoxin system VapC family toxin [Streptomyces ureilyticus]
MISSTALADTSFFVARETGRPMATAMSRGILISTITIGELSLGVQAARTEADRSRRLATLLMASEHEVVAPNRIVASVWSQLMAEITRSGRRLPKARVNDGWIAATARAHGVPVITQDAGFAAFPGVQVIRV